jgi:hypothetical protein
LSRDRELQRHERLVGAEQTVSVVPDVPHDRRVGDSLQEIVDDDVLIVLPEQAAGLLEGLALLHPGVVGLEKGQMKLGDDEVFVVTRIADSGGAVEHGVLVRIGARKVVVVARQPYPQPGLDPRQLLVGAGHLAQMHALTVARSHLARRQQRYAVDAVQIEGRTTLVHELPADLVGAQRRGVRRQQFLDVGRALFEGDVVVDELAEIGVDRR